ncbi:MAG: prepilin-type N-terminal cleavage/methylation domain-containing protein [Sumerlaeia bacterium]
MKRTAKGFTLVEIMIVVAIIGILIAIAVPGFIKARETSRRRACQENLTKIDGAIQQYILENNLQDLATTITDGELEDADLTGAGELIGPNSYLKATPQCPSGGDYTLLEDVGPYGEAVECSIHNFPTGDPDLDNATTKRAVVTGGGGS